MNIECNIQNIMIPSRDGVKLHTAIYSPLNFKGKTGAIIVRCPYLPTSYFQLPDPDCLKNGFVFVVQSCRGTSWSEGEFDPAEPDLERNDAEDLLQWLSEQPWFNGRAIMKGDSYGAHVQWNAMRAFRPELVGITPRVSPLWGCSGSALPGGNMAHSFSVCWNLRLHHARQFSMTVPDYYKMGLMEKQPILDADKFAGYGELKPFRKFMKRIRKPAEIYRNLEKDFEQFRAPAYIAGGWFDMFKEETLETFRLMKQYAKNDHARNHTRMVIGPWGHLGLLNPDLFGKENNWKGWDKNAREFSYSLLKNPAKDPLPKEPIVTYFMLGENKWYHSETWPPANGNEKIFYLHSGGNANSLKGDGTLSGEKNGAAEPYDSYLSDPNQPVPSNLGQTDSPGCYDRNPILERSDVLVFTSAPMKKSMTVAGEVKLRFYAKVSTPDTDFFATLTDVTPDGKSYLLTQGMIRARYRKSLKKAELLEQGKIYEFEINLSHIAVKFLPGHSIRLDLCGQNFPVSDRNCNTGNDPLTDTELRISRHEILHDADHPAQLILPVLTAKK